MKSSRPAKPDISRGAERRISHTAKAGYIAREAYIALAAASSHAPQAQIMPRSGNSCRRSLQLMRYALEIRRCAPFEIYRRLRRRYSICAA